MELWSIVIASAISILAIEWILWRLFRRRVDGLHLHLAHTTTRKFFTLMRIRICAIIHTLFLLCATILPLIFLW